MFDNLQERLERSFKILKGEGKITEINVAETLKDIRRALLDADVSFRVAKDFCDRVKVKAMGQNVLTAVKPQQMMVKIVHDELADFMGSASQDINIKGNPGIVLVAGLNGSGKTTFSAKLANNIKSKRGMKVLLAACDTFRPAAIEQLKVLGEGIEVPVYTEEGVKDPIRIARNAIAKAKAEGYSVVIIDTAGRLAVDQELMDEISALHKAVNPTESLFVVDAMTGQDAVETAKVFNERLDFDGVVLTKMDGDTRAAPRFPSSTSPASRSSSSPQERRWRRWMCSILDVSPTGSSEWVTLSPSSRRHRSSLTRSRPGRPERNWPRTSSVSWTSTTRSSRSRRWATSRILPE